MNPPIRLAHLRGQLPQDTVRAVLGITYNLPGLGPVLQRGQITYAGIKALVLLRTKSTGKAYPPIRLKVEVLRKLYLHLRW